LFPQASFLSVALSGWQNVRPIQRLLHQLPLLLRTDVAIAFRFFGGTQLREIAIHLVSQRTIVNETADGPVLSDPVGY
jgi:hypothetical protein